MKQAPTWTTDKLSDTIGGHNVNLLCIRIRNLADDHRLVGIHIESTKWFLIRFYSVVFSLRSFDS